LLAGAPSGSSIERKANDGMQLIQLAEQRILPDWLIRVGTRRLLTKKLRQERSADLVTQREASAAFIDRLRTGPLAVCTDAANEQHYEVPPAFFRRVLGKRMKYSCALWPPGIDSLDEAEEAMLAVTCERAGIGDGMEILELGCGWGSLSLWIAERFPGSRVLAVSNSTPQRRFIEGECAARGLRNLSVRTCDMNVFDPAASFDRTVDAHVKTLRAKLRAVAPDEDTIVTHRGMGYALREQA